MDKTQRQMMLFMPLIFVVVIINFPAGVLVYWITTNTWTMGQQYVIASASGRRPAARRGRADRVVRAPEAARMAAARMGRAAAASTGLLRGRLKPATEPEKVGAGASRTSRGAPPPPPPRKKKKRSGRRR